MGNYSQATDFSDKDLLDPGDPEKAISGQDIDSELGLISNAIDDKIDGPAAPVEGDVLQYVSGVWTNSTVAELSVSGGGLWSLVAAYTAASAAEVKFYHDGIENTGTDLQANYSYAIEGDHIYGTDGKFLLMQLWEGAGYRQTAASYRMHTQRLIDGVDNHLDYDSEITYTYASTSAFGQNASTGLTFRHELRNLGDAKPSNGVAHGMGITAAGNTYLDHTVWRVADALSQTLTTDHVRLYSSDATAFNGEFRLYRRSNV